MQYHRLAMLVSASLAVFALRAPNAGAQSVYGFDGGASAALEHTGPPGAACGYPTGPLLSIWPTTVPFACPTAAALGPPPGVFFGDIAVNKVKDTVWVCDGFVATEYTSTATPGVPAGAPLTSYFPVLLGGLPITGMGFDAAAGLIWFTDGFVAWAEVPPPPPGCGLAGLLIVPPFPLPAIAGALVTDIEWDPITGTLWTCDFAGIVANVLVGGGLGPFGFFPVAPGACGLGPGLQGLAVDSVGSTLNGIPTLYATDGFMISYFIAGGPPAPPTFHTPLPCFPALGPLLGLGLAERALPYGLGVDNTGLAAPLIGSMGEAISPSGGFSTTISGSVPGGVAGLFLGTSGFLCPAFPTAGLLLYVAPPVALVGTAVIDPFGNAILATPIPPALPIGTAAWLQWLVVTPSPSLQVTEGLSVVIGL